MLSTSASSPVAMLNATNPTLRQPQANSAQVPRAFSTLAPMAMSPGTAKRCRLSAMPVRLRAGNMSAAFTRVIR